MIEDAIALYLSSLEKGNLDDMMKLFADNAIVNSPLYGKVKARDFYEKLFSDTSRSIISVLNIFTNKTNKLVGAGHFRYEWTMKDDTVVSFECIDVFRIDRWGWIEELSIIYDTYGIRESFGNLK